MVQISRGGRTPVSDPAVELLIGECARAAGIVRREIDTEETVERTIYALVLEGARILEEGFAARAVEIDIIYVNGYGFPAHRGGPMWYADAVGLAKVLERIAQFEQQQGLWWKPPELLRQLAASGRKFADWDREKTASE
jgi:3-hydroxyacyl-CoA dehydrogenase